MKKTKLLTLLLSLALAVSAAGAAVTAFAAEDPVPQSAETTLCAFNQIGWVDEQTPYVEGWAGSGEFTLTEDENGTAGQAVNFGMVDTSWGEPLTEQWSSTANVNKFQLSSLAGQQSISFTFYVENINYLRRIVVDYYFAGDTGDTCTRTFLTTDATRANPDRPYASGKTVGNDILGINRNGWQTVSANFSDLQELIGVDLTARDLSLIQIGFVSDKNMTVKFSDISVSTEAAKSDGVITSFENNWDGNNLPLVAWGVTKSVVANNDGENSAWEIAAGGGGGFNYLLPRPVPMAGFNGLHVRLNVDAHTKLDHIMLYLSDDAQYTNDYKINITPFITQDGWQDLYIPLSSFETQGSADMVISGLRMETKTYKDDSNPSDATSFALDLVELTVVPEITLADGKSLSVTNRNPVDLDELFAITGAENYTVTAEVSKDGTPVDLQDNVFTPAEDGMYLIEFYASPNNTDGDIPASSCYYSFNYTVDADAPVVTVIDNIVIVQGQTVNAAQLFTVTDSFDENPAVSYTVLKDGQPVSLGENNTFTAEYGSYTVTATATDAAGNESDPVTASFTVADTVDPVIAVAEKELTGAVGTQIDLAQNVSATDNVTAAGEIDFEFKVFYGISEITLEDGTKFTPSKGGTYSVTVIAADAAGNEAEDAFTVVVPDTVKPEISGIDGISKTAAVGSKVSLAGISAKDDVAVSCQLNITVKLGDETISLADDNSFTPAKEGTYTVTVTASDGTNTAEQTFEITVTAAAGDNGGGCSSAAAGTALGACGLLLAGIGALALLRRRRGNR